MIIPELTSDLQSIIFAQLREGEKYAYEIKIEGLDNPIDPWHTEGKRRLLETLETQQKVHRLWHGRTPGRWRIGPLEK